MKMVGCLQFLLSTHIFFLNSYWYLRSVDQGGECSCSLAKVTALISTAKWSRIAQISVLYKPGSRRVVDKINAFLRAIGSHSSRVPEHR